MSIGSWEPEAGQSGSEFNIDIEVLNTFIRLAESSEMSDLPALVSEEIQREQKPLMTLGRDKWARAAESLSNNDIQLLVKFFTLAEGQLSGWEAGAESPVIWLVKILRQRKSPPSKELLLWIKANSDNRFLPNGAL